MDKKYINKNVKEILKENDCIAIFSEGITLMQGEGAHLIASISWSLNALRKYNNDIYTAIMEDLERLKKKDEKESEE
jgi:hypothetical protein